MSFVFYAQLERSCPDVDHCPHLGGASLGGVVLSANANDEWLQSLLRQIDSLREESAAKNAKSGQLQDRLEPLERGWKAERQQQFKATTRQEDVPAEANEPAAEVKKRAAPVGHPGWFRPTPTHIDRTILLSAPTCCPHCQAAVVTRPDLPAYDPLQEDFSDGQPTVTCDRHEEGRCTNPQCHRGVALGTLTPNQAARAMYVRC